MLLLLLESIAYAEEAAPGFTIAELWEHSGFIARSVIVTLILMLFASILVTIERLIAFNRARNQSMRLAAEIVAPLQAGDIDKALKASFAMSLHALREDLHHMGEEYHHVYELARFTELEQRRSCCFGSSCKFKVLLERYMFENERSAQYFNVGPAVGFENEVLPVVQYILEAMRCTNARPF